MQNFPSLELRARVMLDRAFASKIKVHKIHALAKYTTETLTVPQASSVPDLTNALDERANPHSHSHVSGFYIDDATSIKYSWKLKQ